MLDQLGVRVRHTWQLPAPVVLRQGSTSSLTCRELEWLVKHMHDAGPFAMSANLSLVDCATAPFLLRLYILQHYRFATAGRSLGLCFIQYPGRLLVNVPLCLLPVQGPTSSIDSWWPHKHVVMYPVICVATAVITALWHTANPMVVKICSRQSRILPGMQEVSAISKHKRASAAVHRCCKSTSSHNSNTGCSRW